MSVIKIVTRLMQRYVCERENMPQKNRLANNRRTHKNVKIFREVHERLKIDV